jgi:hypothetical protein
MLPVYEVPDIERIGSTVDYQRLKGVLIPIERHLDDAVLVARTLVAALVDTIDDDL